jgi:methyl-accepting chemotaxis protein
MLNKIKIGTKLQVGFLIVSAIASINAIQAIYNFRSLDKGNTYLYEKCTLPLAQVGTIATDFMKVRVSLRDMLRGDDAASVQATADKMKNDRMNFAKSVEDFKATVTGETDQKSYEAFCQSTSEFNGVIDELESLARQKKIAEAWKVIDLKGPAVIREEQAQIDALTRNVLQNSKLAAENNAKETHAATVMMIIILLIGSGIGIAIGIFLTRSIAGPLSKCVEMMRELGKGHLKSRVHMEDRFDEIGILSQTMDRFADDLQNHAVADIRRIGDGDLTGDIAVMDDRDEIGPAIQATRNSLKQLIEDLETLSRQHDCGETDAVIDVDKFRGAYREMAEGVNVMVAGHLAVNRKAMACVAEFGKGNFEAELEKFPGKQASINETIEQVRDNLKALIIDTRMLTTATLEGKLWMRADATSHQGDFRAIVQGINDTLDAVIGPLNVAAEYVDQMSRGELPDKITENYSGDFNNIKNNLNQCIDALGGLLSAHAEMREQHDRGMTDAVMPEEKFQGAYAVMAKGINTLVQSHIADKLKIVEVVGQYAQGDFSPDMDRLPGKKAAITEAIDKVKNQMLSVNQEIMLLVEAAKLGKLSVRADESRFQYSFKEMVKGLNEVMDAVVGPLNVAAKCIDDISKGSIPENITETFQGDFNQLIANLNTCIDSVNLLAVDTKMLSSAALEGKLWMRADATAHQGDFRTIIQGINDTLDAVIGPLNVAADYVDKISRGEIPEKITANYSGDFNNIKNNLNQCIDALSGILSARAEMSDQHDKGMIGAIMPVTMFQGAYAEMAKGINSLALSHIAVTMKIVEVVGRYAQGDFSVDMDRLPGEKAMITEAVDKVKSQMLSVNKEIMNLVDAAKQGRLAVRADTSRFQYSFKDMVSGLNDVLDAVVGPLNVAAKNIDDISKGVVPPKITETFQGDFSLLINNLNTCIDAVNLLATDTRALSSAAGEGRLSVRADASKHEGDFRKIVQSVNDTLDAVIKPVNEAAAVLEQIASRNMTVRMRGDYKGDLATIKHALNTAVDNLDQALTQAAESAQQVAGASLQISAGSQSLAQGANEQASSLEEVSSSLEEMSSMTKQNAENALQAKSLAGEAKSNAAGGVGAMGSMAAAINKIKESSDQTAKIVKTIDEIAMQTNLLALNAAVEAARAGEAGRGFAVVAEEVRNLAQRSAQAAKNTADMITESVKNAEQGVRISGEVANSFESIAASSKKVDDLISEIAAASQEQSQGIDQLNNAVAQMDKVTQQNAANSEESASSAEELSSQAEELQSMISQFKLSVSTDRIKEGPQQASAKRQSAGRSADAELQFAGRRSGREKIDPEGVIPLRDEALREF